MTPGVAVSSTATPSSAPWHPVEPLPADVVALIRRRAIFECCKWDPQVEDVSTIADVPVVLARDTWRELSRLAVLLAGELAAAEAELCQRPELHQALGLPPGVVKALAQCRTRRASAGVRFVRFDFHHTDAGWRISEANTDVPGGLNEASGLPRIVAPFYPGTETAGDVAGAYADALADLQDGATVALVHATAYSDDRQVMAYLARCLEARGVRPFLVSPVHLRWRGGGACFAAEWASGRVDSVVRFFPAEWLCNLPPACGWTSYFGGASTPISNPATAVLTQSKRFPLIWDELRSPLHAWRALLPETVDPRAARWEGDDGWVIKPALGRVGEDVAIAGVTGAKDRERIARDARRNPSHWVVQRRFLATPMRIRDRQLYPTVGVYTVNGYVAGAYARIAERPLVDARARDAAVLVAES